MANGRVVERLNHMLGALDEATEYLAGRDFGAYRRSVLTRRAVERCLEIVSEASRHVPQAYAARQPEIPWDAVRGIGNILRHRNFAVSDHVVWRTATFSLPELRVALVSLLASANASGEAS